MAEEVTSHRDIVISASIVLYKENSDELTRTVHSFLATPLSKKLFLIDNSPTNILEEKFQHSDISYIFVNDNIGFGRGHNYILGKIRNLSKYHLVLNPDVIFDPLVIPTLINNLEKDTTLALIAPKAVFPDGKPQYSCRRYPTFWELMVRRVPFFKGIFPGIIGKGEYRDRDLSQSFYPDFIHGCFLLFKTDVFINLKGFDESYFLYMEDVDICKKIDKMRLRKMYFPEVEIIHVLKKKSLHNIKLFKHHTISVVKYFYKWHKT